MRRVPLAALLVLGACHKAAPKPPAPPKPTLTLLATGDVWGQVEPCG
ncbi:MAG: hypothetical protein JST54_32550 [Deltaproteobacteria bacterium]|nr:hypothetical protein [Deltaproteobacteria bacterium]